MLFSLIEQLDSPKASLAMLVMHPMRLMVRFLKFYPADNNNGNK